jgi:DNA replication and repair protein RecF
VLQRLQAGPAQVFVTATETPQALADSALPIARFHVEHGQAVALS